MNAAAYTANKQNAINAYLNKDIMEASQERLLIKVYDFAIQQCQLNNIEKTNRALNVLIDALEFNDDTREFATGLLRLYEFSQDQMRKGNTEIVLKMLNELKASWVETFTANKG